MVEEKQEEKVSEAKPTEAKSEGGKVKLSKKAEEILKSVEEMSVLELNELVKALEDKFGVSSAPMAMAAPAAGAVPAGGEAAPEEKAAYDVVLADSGANKIAVIKALREINQNLGLAEAKGIADNPGKAILEGAKKEDAEAAKQKLEAAGAKVELK